MAAGIQFWTINYLIVVLKVEETEAQVSYITILLSSLVTGVYIGAILADLLGGYVGKSLKYALTLCSIFAATATIFGYLVTFNFDQENFAALLWLFLFSGSAV